MLTAVSHFTTSVKHLQSMNPLTLGILKESSSTHKNEAEHFYKCYYETLMNIMNPKTCRTPASQCCEILI